MRDFREEYGEFMEQIKVDDAMEQRILQRIASMDIEPPAVRRRKKVILWIRNVAAVICLALTVGSIWSSSLQNGWNGGDENLFSETIRCADQLSATLGETDEDSAAAVAAPGTTSGSVPGSMPVNDQNEQQKDLHMDPGEAVPPAGGTEPKTPENPDDPEEGTHGDADTDHPDADPSDTDRPDTALPAAIGKRQLYKDPDSLEVAVGFFVEIPGQIPFDVTETICIAYDGKIAEIIWCGGKQELVLRKTPECEDIYQGEQIDDEALYVKCRIGHVALKGKDGKDGIYDTAVWTEGGYSYVLYFEPGQSSEAWVALLESMQ